MGSFAALWSDCYDYYCYFFVVVVAVVLTRVTQTTIVIILLKYLRKLPRHRLPCSHDRTGTPRAGRPRYRVGANIVLLFFFYRGFPRACARYRARITTIIVTITIQYNKKKKKMRTIKIIIKIIVKNSP